MDPKNQQLQQRPYTLRCETTGNLGRLMTPLLSTENVTFITPVAVVFCFLCLPVDMVYTL